MVRFLLMPLLGYIAVCNGEVYKAFYVPDDKMENYRDHPNFTENKHMYAGFTLKDRLFSGEEYDTGVILKKSKDVPLKYAFSQINMKL